MTEFFQDGPQLENTYLQDPLLIDALKTYFPQKDFNTLNRELTDLGRLAAGGWLELAAEAEAHLPVHVPFDPWGKRIDHIKTCRAWNDFDRISAEKGIVATAYENQFGEFSRLAQMAKLYLFHPSSAIYSCPLAMTDGAARVLSLYGDQKEFKDAFDRLTTRDPEKFWTSGQWMTEKTGGSDVSLTSTIAEKHGNEYRLHGVKWFTSATTSQMALTLARIKEGNEISKDLSLFFIKLRNDQNELDGIEILRLKDKLGTKALPTAELKLVGARGLLVGGPGKGVKKIATMLNITRLYNTVCSVGYMRRGLQLIQSYDKKRMVFGKTLSEQPLHQETIFELEAITQASFHLMLYCGLLLGREEAGTATENEKVLLRLLTPVAKLFTGKNAVKITSEILECFGGAGYVEDTGLPSLLRNAQVLSIWEGTTNVLSLDVLRAIQKENAFQVFAEWVASKGPEFAQGCKQIQILLESDPERNARKISFGIATLTATILMAEFSRKHPPYKRYTVLFR